MGGRRRHHRRRNCLVRRARPHHARAHRVLRFGRPRPSALIQRDPSPGCRSDSATTPWPPLARCRPPDGGPSAQTEPSPRQHDERCRDPRPHRLCCARTRIVVLSWRFLRSLRCPRVLTDQAVNDLSALAPGGHVDRLARHVQGRPLLSQLMGPMLV
jgi:hypothetical protein